MLAIENCVMAGLSDVFSPSFVAMLNEEQLASIASESQEIREERSRLQEKLDALKAGKRILQSQECNTGASTQEPTPCIEGC